MLGSTEDNFNKEIPIHNSMSRIHANNSNLPSAQSHGNDPDLTKTLLKLEEIAPNDRRRRSMTRDDLAELSPKN